MKALTVSQPWAFAIVALGKSVENRTWATPYRGPLLIHAGMSFKNSQLWLSTKQHELWKRRFKCPSAQAADLIYGGVVGQVELVACIQLDKWDAASPDAQAQAPTAVRVAMNSPWVEGPFCWILANPVRYEIPVAVKGNLSLWQPDRTVETLCEAEFIKAKGK